MRPQKLVDILKFCCKLSEDVFLIVKPVVRRNAYFAHLESILIAMINDDRSYIRELERRRISKACKNNSNGIRQFKIPQLSFASKDYVSMIDRKENDTTEPPFCAKLTYMEIANNIKLKIPICLPALPCYTQPIEQTVKLVTDSSQKVIGSKNRVGYNNALLTSRSKFPMVDIKNGHSSSYKFCNCCYNHQHTSIAQFAIITRPIVFCAFLIHYDTFGMLFLINVL